MITVRERVRFVETDMMGVAHHSNHFRWFEMGRVEYLRQVGIDLNDLMRAGILFPIIEAGCKYHASAHFDDHILIETRLADVSRAKMDFAYQIRREGDGELLASGHTVNVFTGQNGKIVRLPAEYYDKLAHAER
jgi:acyl-CoA thioester hydrolase